MTEVTLFHEKPVNVLAIVAELKEQNLEVNKDFTFAFYPSRYDSEQHYFIPKHTIFSFTNEMYASWFALKYCNNKL